MLTVLAIILCFCVKSEILSLICVLAALVGFLYRIASNIPKNGI